MVLRLSFHRLHQLFPNISLMMKALHFNSLKGIVGIVSESYTLIGLHTVLAPAIGAAICAIHTGVYLLVNSRCSMAQNAFMGCATCACSITNSCTKALISSVPGCGSCQTPTIELCNNMMSNYGLLFLCMVGNPLLSVIGIMHTCYVLVNRSMVLPCIMGRESTRQPLRGFEYYPNFDVPFAGLWKCCGCGCPCGRQLTAFSPLGRRAGKHVKSVTLCMQRGG